MTDVIQQMLDSLRAQQQVLKTELERLKKAEMFLSQMDKPQQELHRETPRTNVTLSEAIRLALKELGEANSAEVIQHINQHFLNNVNKNSVRSLLSVWASKGDIAKHGGKYTLKNKTPEAAGTASGA